MAKSEARPVEAWVETKAQITFGAGDDFFWIKIGPAYDEHLTLRLVGNWPRHLYESLGEYLKGHSDEIHRDPNDDGFTE